jgi:glycosyltransferase involved in cell wall biosynthesis
VRLLLAAAARSTNTVSFIEAFARRGHDLHVATLHPGRIAEATVHDLGRSERGLSRLEFLRAVPAFRRLHRRLKPDLTLGYYASSYGLLSSVVPSPRVVITAGGDVLGEGEESALRRRTIPILAGIALRRADLVLCWAPHMTDAVIGLGVPAKRILTLPRGIDVSRFFPAPAPPAGPPCIISTRSISPFYRPELLLDAFFLLRNRGVVAQLELAGDGPSVAALARRVSSSPHAKDVVLTGRLDAATLAEHLRSAAVYASFPPSDGVSASLLEAMASGVVPVVSDLPSNRDWVDSDFNGLLVSEPVTVDTVAAALERALRDDGLRARARESGVARVRERADRDKNVARFEEAFDATIGRVRELARA